MAELKGAHSLPSNRKIVGEKLHDVLQKIGKREDVPTKTKLAYARRVIRHVNENEPKQVGQKKRSSTGEIKVRGLSHKRAKQSDPRL